MSSKKQFSLSSIRDAKRIIMRACGALTSGHGADEALWTSQLERAEGREVALDLSCVSDLDAHGIGVLADLGRRAVQRGVRLSVVAASAVSERLARLTRLDRALPGDWHQRSGKAHAC
jgi:anti-anti-sigma factor